MGKFWNELLMVLMLADVLFSALAKREGKARKGKGENQQDVQQQQQQQQRNSTSFRIPIDPILTGDHTVGAGDHEVDFDKAIDDMVSQVKNNPALYKSKCVVDRHLWMSNTRSLSPWSYRINHDENRRPVDIPEAKCACAGCINPFTMQEDRSMTSVLIYAKIPVRRLLCPRKKKKKCVPRFRTVVESIAVGCTCIAG